MIIELLDGTQIDTAGYNLTRLFHYVPSLEVEHETATIEGAGTIITGTRLTNRTITVEFMYKSQTLENYYVIRDKINALFCRDDSYYIIFKREPHKRYKIRLASQFEVPPKKWAGQFTIEFITADRYAESVKTTSNITNWNEAPVQYTFNTSTFNVKNFGSVKVDPRESFFEITLKGTFENGVTITNTTTGDIYKYNAKLIASDELKLTGVKTLKNNVSDFKNTNKKLITLNVGDNNFTVTGGTVTSIKFNFKYLYK